MKVSAEPTARTKDRGRKGNSGVVTIFTKNDDKNWGANTALLLPFGQQ
jgi:hypothetical protein